MSHGQETGVRSLEKKKGRAARQEPQQTATSKGYSDLVSVLSHALQAAQADTVSIRDAEPAGQQLLAQFF
jgi:hypothetical protein